MQSPGSGTSSWLKGRPDAGQVEADGLIAGPRRNVLWFRLNQPGRQGFPHANRFAQPKRTVGFRVVVAAVRVDLELVGGFKTVRVDLRFERRVVFSDVRHGLTADGWWGRVRCKGFKTTRLLSTVPAEFFATTQYPYVVSGSMLRSLPELCRLMLTDSPVVPAGMLPVSSCGTRMHSIGDLHGSSITSSYVVSSPSGLICASSVALFCVTPDAERLAIAGCAAASAAAGRTAPDTRDGHRGQQSKEAAQKRSATTLPGSSECCVRGMRLPYST